MPVRSVLVLVKREGLGAAPTQAGRPLPKMAAEESRGANTNRVLLPGVPEPPSIPRKVCSRCGKSRALKKFWHTKFQVEVNVCATCRAERAGLQR